MKIVDCPFCVERLGYVVSTCEECVGSGEISEAQEVGKLKRNGTTTAHGRIWPLYEREAFNVTLNGSIDRADVESAEALKAELDAVLRQYGVEVTVEPVLVLFMSPEDQAEKNALDELALKAA
jgi:RecJ-like exonuclease